MKHTKFVLVAIALLLALTVNLSSALAQDARKEKPPPAGDDSRNDLPKGSADYGSGSASGEVTAQSYGICTVYASDPVKVNNAIHGEGTQICSGLYYLQRIKVSVQQYRGLGFWSTKAYVWSPWTSFPTNTRLVSWKCAAGSGTQTYRIVTDGEFIDYDGATYKASVQSLNYLRTKCPS
ncbi:MAG: hypothetical protein M3198_11125 [Actinomycetota bacterium]|nr:hypothetical protein [Actinomycetota bacterium]